jgi:outer membrane protein assembly factor BamD (BamD/ComL family)
MTKQRRPNKTTKTKASSSVQARSSNRAQVAAGPSPLPTPVPVQRRSTYIEAVAMYERGLDALQRHDYVGAAGLFNSVLRQYPEEKELHERVRLYLNICQRQVSQVDHSPRTIDERLYAATIAINGGNYDEAISQLHLVRDEDPDNDHALYMLAVAHAQRDEHAAAIAHLERAIAVNPENRALARQDPDLDPLRADESFRAALEAPASQRIDRRRPLRARPGR